MPPAARPAKSRATLASIQLDTDLRSLLVHLPNSLYSPLLERGVAPQSIVVEVARADANGNESFPDNESDIHKVYLGWTGMSAGQGSAAASSSSQHPPLAISPAVPSLFNPPLSQQSTVRITLLRSPPLPTATQVDVTPLSPDDWEILSLHAGEVEESMLGQVRAAKAGMIIAAHVGRGGRTICKFRVDSTIPPTSASPTAHADLARAVRLSTDTEVVIAPRTRAPSAADVAAAERYELNGKGGEASGARQARAASRQALDPTKARALLSKRLFRVLPLSVHPSHQRYPNSALLNSHDVKTLALAFTPEATNTTGRCAITKIPCPSAPDVESGKHRQAGDAAAVAKDKGSAATSANGEQASQPSHAVPARPTVSGTFETIGAEDGEESVVVVPLRHVWLGNDLRRKLSISDWDLVCFSAPSPGAGAGAKGFGAQLNGVGKEDEGKDDSETEGETVLAGVDAIVADCISTITGTFSSRALASSAIASSSVAFQGALALLLTGGPGSGKTSLSNLLTQELAKPPHYVSRLDVDCTPHSETRLPVLRDLFSQWTSAAAWRAPCVLVLDNVDRIIPAEMEHVDSPRSRQLAEALVARIKDVVKRHEVFVLLTAQSSTSVHSLLNASHLLSTTVQLKPPSKEARKEILTHLVAQKATKGGLKAEGLNTITLAGQTEGYLPADMKDLVSRAVHQAAIRSAGMEAAEQALSLTMADFTAAHEGFTPMSLRDVKLEKSSIAWSDIGGLQETRRVLRETLEWPTKYAAIFASCPLRLRSGLLLYGYPGCGKTLLASAVAKECGLNFISVKGPEILNKYIGASEKSVRDLFDRAQAAKPCVLFFDEFDSIAPKRGHDSTGVTDRVVNQLLTQMDGAEGLDGVYVLAATSRPDLIDSALLRPGRLDKSLLCDMPSLEDRIDIMKAVSNKVKLHPDVDLAKWAARTEGFSGADLQALLYNANLETIHEAITAAEEATEGKAEGGAEKPKDSGSADVRFVSLRAKRKEKAGEKGGETTMSGAERQALTRRLGLILESSEGSAAATTKDGAKDGKGKPNKAKALVTDVHLERSLTSTRPSVPEAERKRLERIYRAFSGDERPGDFPDGEASQLVGARESLM